MPGLQDVSLTMTIGVVMSFLALVLAVISTGSPYWLEIRFGDFYAHYGIWTICAHSPGSPKECRSFSEFNFDTCPGHIKATQTMDVLGCISGAAAVINVLLCGFGGKISHIIGIILNFSAAGFVLLGVIIYTAEYIRLQTKLHSSDIHLSWAYIIGIFSGGVYFTSGCILVKNLRHVLLTAAGTFEAEEHIAM